MSKCSINFESKYANIKDIGQVCIDDYINEKYSSIHIPTCITHGHQLIPVKCTKRTPHFRHKYNADMEGTPMTQWHAEWQSNFPITEQPFKNKSGQMKDRRADVVISDFKRIVEIQHSYIESGEVNNRNKDYGLHGHNVIWVIHGQGNIVVKKLGDRLILDFSSNPWIYESFLGCESVYYDINGFIYKIKPSLIMSRQIDVNEPKLKSDFIEALKTQETLWHTNEIPQSFVYVKQRGAGSGKTFGMMQLLNTDPEITHFQWVIFITKQHAAVNVMYSEFMDQYKKGLLYNISIIGDPLFENKKYIIHYKHKITNIETCAVFATVDSFTYAVGEASKNISNQFESIVSSIKNGVSKVKRSGILRFAGVDPFINKETIIMIDETQDLSELYGEAFLKFVGSTNTNLCIVGDRLQSLAYRENALTFLHSAEFAMMKLVKEEASNVVRRFSNQSLVNFVNSIIPFEKYDLPPMTPAKIEESLDALTVFSAKTIYANQSADEDDVVKEVTDIMAYFIKEVYEYNRIPEDFLIVTPFTKKNPLVDALQLAINMFWKDTMENNLTYVDNIKRKDKYWKNINPSEYTRYAIFHKSQDMGSINLTDSEHATRIVSIHSSKGDGRKVVFVIGVTQSALQRFSQVTDNIIYDSLLHVAITRQKEHLYFRLETNGDDIHQRISKSSVQLSTTQSNIEFDFQKNKIKLSHLSNDIFKFAYEHIYENIICKNNPPKLSLESEKKLLIDMGDHNIRYASMFMNIMVHICNHEQKTNSSTKHQFYAILGKLKSDKIKSVSEWKEYMNILAKNSKNKKETKENKIYFIPVLQFIKRESDKDYDRYYQIIISTMKRIIEELKSVGKRQINYFCPLECVVLYYMIECIENGKYQHITISDVYNIIDTYSKVFDYSATGHDNCNCKKHFSEGIGVLSDSQRKQHEYLRNHYDRLKHICMILDTFVSKHPTVNWLYEHGVEFSGGLDDDNKDFDIHTGYALIGYDNKNVYIFNIKPQFNELNFNEVMVNSICDTWILSNLSKDSNNYTKFNGKHIISCVLSLNKTELYTVDWTKVLSDNKDIIINLMYTIIYKKYSNKHEQYYNTFSTILKEFDGAKKIMEQCKKSLDDDKTAKYISNFFRSIDGKLIESSGKGEKQEILANYSNKDKFIKTLDKFLDNSLMGFLCMTDEEDN